MLRSPRPPDVRRSHRRPDAHRAVEVTAAEREQRAADCAALRDDDIAREDTGRRQAASLRYEASDGRYGSCPVYGALLADDAHRALQAVCGRLAAEWLDAEMRRTVDRLIIDLRTQTVDKPVERVLAEARRQA